MIAAASFFVLACQGLESPETQEHKIVASVGAYNTKANFHTTETLNVTCDWNGRETLRVYYKKSDGKYHSIFANSRIAKLEEGGKSADFTYSPEPEWGLDGKDQSYQVAVFTVNCAPTIDPADGSIYLDARLIRQPLKDFELPVYYVGEVVNGSVEATFSHYYAYEFLHVKNTSDKTIEFSLNGYETPWIWYKKLASVGLEDGVVYNKSWSGLTPAEVSYPVSIAPGSSDIIVSAYIPNDFIIKDASIVATIDGNVVKSTNKKSSAAPLVPGRAYHMYATWDGNELKFINNGSAAGIISVDKEKIEFGDVFVDETGTEYLTIHNNGTAEQKVKVSIEDYTYSSPFDLPGAELGDSYVYKVVPAGGSRSVALSFRASSPDDYDGNALVSLDGSDKVECIVPLHGKGIAKPDEDSFHLSKNSIEIFVHTMMNVRICNGSGDYDVVNENPDIVDYGIRIYSTANSPATRIPGDSGGKITDDFWEITGKKVGEATLRLADKKTKEELTLHVKVELAPELTLARHNVELAVAERSSVEVLTGSDWYDITIDNPSVVSANFVTISSVGGSSIYEDDRPSSGIFVMLEGLSVGQTTVRVKDMSSYEEVTLSVTVTGGDKRMYAVLQDSILTFYYDDYRDRRDGETFDLDIFDHPGWFQYRGSIKKYVFDETFSDARPVSMFAWFAGARWGERPTFEGTENLNTSKVTTMKELFNYSSAQSLDLRFLDTSNVTDMTAMFNDCNELRRINISSFNTGKVQHMSWMFADCQYLESLDLRHFDTSNVEDMHSMFSDCHYLYELDLSSFNTSKVKTMWGMFWGCSGLESLNISGFNTSNVTEMDCMFHYCSSLTELDVSGFDTSNVVSFASMFQGCSSLRHLDVSGFDTSNATDLGWMFLDCSSLKYIDVSGFNTSKNYYMWSMFQGCSSLQSIDVSHFDTSNATLWSSAFQGCSSLQSIDVSHFDTSNARLMDSMFDGCNNLQNLDVSGFNTSKVEDMSWMFRDCMSLKSIDVSHFNTSNVIDSCSGQEGYRTGLEGMFMNCCYVSSLDLSSFTIQNEVITNSMFRGCNSLKTITVKDDWDMSKVKSSSQMFDGCNNLVGGKGTNYSQDHVDGEYARVDGGASRPGYFTLNRTE